MAAQQLAQTRPGARGALLMYGVPPGLGVRGRVARGRPGAGARQGRRPVLRRGPRGRAGAGRVDRRRRAVPLPRRGAPLRRLVAPGVRRRAAAPAHRARAGVPRRGRARMATTYTIKALDETTWDAFAALVEAQQRRLRRLLVHGLPSRGRRQGDGRRSTADASSSASSEGTTHAALVFDGDDVPRLVPVRSTRRAAADQEPRRLREGRDDPAGLADRVQLRRQGAPAQGRRDRGAGRCARPDRSARAAGPSRATRRAPTNVPAGFLFNGALSTYERLGFERDRKIGKHRWVVTRVVEPH